MKTNTMLAAHRRQDNHYQDKTRQENRTESEIDMGDHPEEVTGPPEQLAS
jgi:hypothetical protein